MLHHVINCVAIFGRKRVFFIYKSSRPVLGPSNLPTTAQQDCVLGIKRPWREAVHSVPSNATIKNAWNYSSTPFMSSSHGVQLGSGAIVRYSFTERQSTPELSLCQTVTSHVIFWVRVRKKIKKEKEKERSQENRIEVRWKRGKKEKEMDRKTNESWKKGRKGRRKEARNEGRRRKHTNKNMEWKKEEAFNICTLGYWMTFYFATGKSRGKSPQWQSQNTRHFCEPGWSQSYERRDSPAVQFVKQSVGTWIGVLHLINVPFCPFRPGTIDIKKHIIWKRTRIKTFYLTNRQINTVKHAGRVINQRVCAVRREIKSSASGSATKL